jgi:K+-sensing histidine kinase KdpD
MISGPAWVRTGPTLGSRRRAAGQGRVNIVTEPAKKPSRSPTARVEAGRLGEMTVRHHLGRPVQAAFALPIGFAGMLLIGVVAAAGDGHVTATMVLALTSGLVAAVALVAEPLAAPPLVVIGWFTVAGFSRPPYGDLHPTGTVTAGLVLALVAGGAAGVGVLVRRLRETVARYRMLPADAAVTLDAVSSGQDSGATGLPATPAGRRRRLPRTGLSARRQLAGVALAAVILPALTAMSAAARAHLALVDDVLLYLIAVIAVTLVGGFWPGVLAAVAAGLLLNWYFTPPVHTWTIEAPQNMLALLLFVTGAVTVSSVVHLAARRSALAADRAAEADTLLTLARTVLGGDDSAQSVLDHMRRTLHITAELRERSGGTWVRVAGSVDPTRSRSVIPVGEDLQLVVYGDASTVSGRILDGYAAQAAAALERQRLRVQAGQAEALEAGNRMRTALLAAVSHDLRTPLASVKAAVSTLRQTDIVWTAEDEAALLATIEEGADRLDSLIGNLLDVTRIHTGALQPFIRPTALDEVAPLVVAGLDGGERVRFDIPDALPLLATDPGLLERALANLIANALRYSPADQPPILSAAVRDGTVTVRVVDHGPGIPLDQRDQVFEPFQQLGDQHTAGGVGLGLAVAKGFLDAVGARLTAESTPGGGLTMRLDLPVATPVRDPTGAAR